MKTGGEGEGFSCFPAEISSGLVGELRMVVECGVIRPAAALMRLRTGTGDRAEKNRTDHGAGLAGAAVAGVVPGGIGLR